MASLSKESEQRFKEFVEKTKMKPNKVIWNVKLPCIPY
jgi:hypothetical protein